MGYTNRYQVLNDTFSFEKENILIKDSKVNIHNLEFNSSFTKSIAGNSYSSFSSYRKEDIKINENWNFIYPIFSPGKIQNNKAIILLHGLNERDWTKYLPWAELLAEQTGRTVILFPLAFHMNRGKKEWSDPRQMSNLVNTRKNSFENINQLSFANAALSNRLTEDPMRFYRAGLQSAHDLIQLLYQIKKGEHPFLEKNTEINFFGYSIGAFLTQIMFMANPGNLLSSSKAVLFCGGTTFDHMFGTSKLIMDSLAYEKLNSFYMQQFNQKLFKTNRFHFSFYLDSIIQSFKAMIPLPNFQWLKELTFSKLSTRIMAIGLLKDKVIPALYIHETLNASGNKNPKIILEDFPYDYTHENPFPVNKLHLSVQVDKCFEQIFSGIALALK